MDTAFPLIEESPKRVARQADPVSPFSDILWWFSREHDRRHTNVPVSYVDEQIERDDQPTFGDAAVKAHHGSRLASETAVDTVFIWRTAGSRASQPEAAATWDTIVLGSGVGGLTAAAALARCGHRVLLPEQHSAAGGLTGARADPPRV